MGVLSAFLMKSAAGAKKGLMSKDGMSNATTPWYVILVSRQNLAPVLTLNFPSAALSTWVMRWARRDLLSFAAYLAGKGIRVSC